METIELIGSTLGLSFVSGVNLYATVFVLGVAIRMHEIHLGAAGQPLNILAHPAVMVVAGLAYILEFFADKIPWIDTVWDSFHTFIRPLGAVLMAAAVLGPIDPVLKLVVIILCGGVAFASHSSKMSTRLLVNHSPEPFTNIAISLAEDVFVLGGALLSLFHPLVALVLVAIFVAVFLWIMPKVFRKIRLQFVALRAWLNKNSAQRNFGFAVEHSHSIQPDLSQVIHVLGSHAHPIPEAYSASMKNGGDRYASAVGVRVGATKSVGKLTSSIGYLILGADHLTFVTRRSFRCQSHSIPFSEVVHARWKRGLMMNRLVISTIRGEKSFYIFKDVDIKLAERATKTAYA